MMARSKAIFARRNVLTIHSPPPAFLIGLPPSAAQPSGIESEGQAKMGNLLAASTILLLESVTEACLSHQGKPARRVATAE